MNEQNTNQQPTHIPDFSSIKEETAFGDAHDTTDFEEEFHPVTVHFDKHLSEYRLSKKLECALMLRHTTNLQPLHMNRE